MSRYINIFEECDTENYVFHILQGARGGGKTYSMLTGLEGLIPSPYQHEEKYILMRRTQDECDTIASDNGTMNPFKKINSDYNTDYNCKKINRKTISIYDNSDYDGDPHGYIMALSTFAHVRGADFCDVDTIVVDEFVPERHVRAIPDEANAYFNAYETVNRNREFDGKPPVQMFWLSNSNNIYNPLLSELGIVNDIERLAKTTGYGKLRYPERSLEFILLDSSLEFKELKAQTAIGRLTAGTGYRAMALDNQYAFNDFSLTGYRKIKNARPLFSVDNIYVYLGKDDIAYACYAKGDVIDRYNSKNMHDQIAVARAWRAFFSTHYINGRFYFETYEIKHILLRMIMDIK